MAGLCGYLLLSEFYKKASMHPPVFYRSHKDCVIEKIGGFKFIKADTVPEKYKNFVSHCTDLSNYFTVGGLEKIIGVRRNYFRDKTKLEGSKKIVYEKMKIGRVVFIKVTDDFLNYCEKGLTPFVIKDEEDESLSDVVIEMYDMKIGFY